MLLSLPDRAERSLGVIPAGTGSDLARGLKLSNSPRRALERALEDEPKTLDVLRVGDGQQERYVINVASAGLSQRVVSAVNDSQRRDRWAYLQATLHALRHEPPLRARIAVDGAPWYEGELVLVAMANGTRFGRGMRIAPGARTDDGWMEVVLIEQVSTRRILRWLPTLYLGWHQYAPFVHRIRAREVTIEGDRPAARFEADGEVSLALPGRVSVVPGVLRLRGLCAARAPAPPPPGP